jgi:signal recognition particle subunit SRP54
MVLSDLGARLHGALAQLSKASVVDEKVSYLVLRQVSEASSRRQVIDALLKELCAALLEADVNVKLVASLRTKVKNQASISQPSDP